MYAFTCVGPASGPAMPSSCSSPSSSSTGSSEYWLVSAACATRSLCPGGCPFLPPSFFPPWPPFFFCWAALLLLVFGAGVDDGEGGCCVMGRTSSLPTSGRPALLGSCVLYGLLHHKQYIHHQCSAVSVPPSSEASFGVYHHHDHHRYGRLCHLVGFDRRLLRLQSAVVSCPPPAVLRLPDRRRR